MPTELYYEFRDAHRATLSALLGDFSGCQRQNILVSQRLQGYWKSTHQYSEDGSMKVLRLTKLSRRLGRTGIY